MRKLFYILPAVILFTALGYSIIHKGQSFPVQQLKNAEENDDREANEDFFLVRSYPDAYVNTHAYTTAMKDAFERKNTERNDVSWTMEGPNNIGGRINCAAVDPANSNVIYVGNASGGIFKTIDGGVTWDPIFDEQPYLSIGAITIDPNNSQVIWAGTGDLNISGYPFIGDGVYKSVNGGDTWTNMGLTETRIISTIIVDPSNSQIIYVATMGIPFVTNTDRGLYKSTDGGTTWSQVLFVDVDAGIIDMVMDPTDPQTIYATSWNRIRNNEVSITYGPDTHIYKTTNGGSSWTMLTSGLPNFITCRIGLAISQQNPQKLYALIVDTTFVAQGIYKTTNGGTSWSNVTGNFDQSQFGTQGWYFGKIFVNPANDQEVYVPGVDMQRSIGGGSSWSQCTPSWWYYDVHADGHFIAFEDENTFYYCTDGGIYKTVNDCNSWSDAEDIPNTQFYHVSYNPFDPGNYYGGAQDNGTTGGNESSSNSWPRIYGGDGFKPIFDPIDPGLFYVETQYGGLAYTPNGGNDYYGFSLGIDGTDRRSWDMPYFMSAQDNSHFFCGTYRIYEMIGAPNSSWVPLSDDLTDGQVSDDRFHVITTISQSPLNDNYLYAGTSDANVWSSTDGGFTWNDVTSSLPERYVTSVNASPNEAGTVYVTHSGYKDDDYVPHVHKSTDNGQTWSDVSGDLPQMAVNDLLIFPGYENDLFAATDAGVYYTENGGVNWSRLGNNMPMMAVYDIELDGASTRLIAGTFARSIWTIDIGSITGIKQVTAANELNIYPNPVTDRLSLKLNISSPAKFMVYDSNGNAVLSEDRTSIDGSYTVSTDRLAEGIYFLNVKDGKNSWSGKFVKVKE